MKLLNVYESGSLISADLVDMTPEEVLKRF